MRQFLLISLLLTVINMHATAQRPGAASKEITVTGIIYDSINDIPLIGASVVFYKQADSTIQGFQVSDFRGAFSVAGLPVRLPLYYILSHTGYESFSRPFEISGDSTILDLGRLNLNPLDSNNLSDVTVRAVVPIKMNKDTLEINPEAFKLDSNAVIEDMLLRVPGMVVWSDGTITMNGRKVEKLLVDGKPFFGGDTKIATQNLPKNAIEKIQLYQEKDPTKIQGADNDKKDSLYSMNVQLKADKKNGLFGKVNAGYGTDQRYDGSGVLQVYDPKNQLGIAVGLDNTNKTSGIGAAAFVDNTFRQGLMSFRYGDPDLSGIKKNYWGTAKWQHSFNEANNGLYYSRLIGDYTYKNTDLDNINATHQTDNLLDYTQTSTSDSRSKNTDRSHDANIRYERRSKFSNYLTVGARFNHSDQNNNSNSAIDLFRNDTAISSNSVNDITRGNSNSVSLNMMTSSNSLLNKGNELNSYNFSLNVNYNDNSSLTHTENAFQSFIDTIASNTLIRNYHTNSENFQGSASLRYNSLRQLLFGINNLYNIDIGLNNAVNFSRSTQDSRVQDLDSITNNYVDNNYLTNSNSLTTFTYAPGFSLSKAVTKVDGGGKFTVLMMNASIEHKWLSQKNTSSLLYRNINRNYQLWQPNLNITYNRSNADKFRLTAGVIGSYSPNLPGMDQLVPVVDTTNRYNVTVGNPLLKMGRAVNGNFSFGIDREKRAAKSNYGISMSLGYNAIHNGVIDSVVYDAAGKSLRYLLNGDGGRRLMLSSVIRFSTKFGKKYQLETQYRPNYSINKVPGFINGVYSFSHNTNWQNALTATFVILDKFNTTLGETITSSKNSQAGAFGISPTIHNYTTSVDAAYYLTKKWALSSNLQYQSNHAQENHSTASIWNVTSTFRFLKDKGELKFTAFDLLHENKNIVNFLNQNSIGTTITNGLQQYFMISFSYFPRKFGSNRNRGEGIRVMGGPAIMLR